MAQILGIAAFSGAALDEANLRRVGQFAAQNGRRGRLFLGKNAAIGICQHSQPGLRKDRPDCSGIETQESIFIADARLDNRQELASLLGIGHSDLIDISDSDLIFKMHRRWGGDGIAKCLGAFAFVNWNAKDQRLVFGRDCFGARTLFYYRTSDFIAFASNIALLQTLPAVPRDLDEALLANYLALNLSTPEATFYRGIERVPSRTIITVGRNAIALNHYWSPEISATPLYHREEDYVDRARELLDSAVAAAISDTPHVAVMASGGLDASAVAATAARLGRAKSITCYTVVPPAELALNLEPHRYLDESDKMLSLGRMHPELSIRLVQEGKLHRLDENPVHLFAASGGPLRNAANLGALGTATDQAVADGHSVIQFGGYGNFGLSWAGLFSLSTHLKRGHFLPLIEDLWSIARYKKQNPAWVFATNVIAPALPPSLRRMALRIVHRNPDDVFRYSALNPEYVAEMGLLSHWRSEGFDPWFLRKGWDSIRFRSHYLFDHNQFSRDFRATARDISGFESRDAHADRRLIEFLLNVPEPLYRRGGIERSFARKVLSDRLPWEIVAERRKGYQGSTWFSRLDARKASLDSEIALLEASPIAKRMLNIEGLKKTLQTWPQDANAAELRMQEIRLAFNRGLHVGRFIRWVENSNTPASAQL